MLCKTEKWSKGKRVYRKERQLTTIDKGEEVFEGYIDEVPELYLEAEVCTFDVIDKNSPQLTLNVEIPYYVDMSTYFQ